MYNPNCSGFWNRIKLFKVSSSGCFSSCVNVVKKYLNSYFCFIWTRLGILLVCVCNGDSLTSVILWVYATVFLRLMTLYQREGVQVKVWWHGLKVFSAGLQIYPKHPCFIFPFLSLSNSTSNNVSFIALLFF